MYNFKKFTDTSTRSDDRISITKSNSFGFPRDFCNNELKKRPPYIVLFFDRKNEAIAFHFTDSKEEKHKFKVNYSKQGYGANVAATSFFKVNKLNPEKYRRKYEWKTHKIEGVGKVYVIDISLQKDERSSAQTTV